MRRALAVPLPLFAGLLVAGCALVTEAHLDQEFQLAPGESAALAGTDLVLRFDEVVDDSRCPASAVCVWAGNGIVKIQSRLGASELVHILGTPSGPLEAVAGAYRIRIVGLDPYPVGPPIPRDDYRVRLRITVD